MYVSVCVSAIWICVFEPEPAPTGLVISISPSG
jgi:hypothetical protein